MRKNIDDYVATFAGGKLSHLTVPLSEVVRLYWNGKVTPDYSEVRKNGGFTCMEETCMEELDRLPMVNGYFDPMYDGRTKDGRIRLRYETPEVYNMMFD